MSALIIHHRDADGYLAAYAALQEHPDAELISIQYGEEPPWEALSRHIEDPVFVVDFSFKREVCEKIYVQNPGLYILDHHDGVIEEIGDLPYVHLDVTTSGCELAWNYFCPNVPMPDLVRAVGDYDTFKFVVPYSLQATKGFDYLLSKAEDKFGYINSLIMGGLESYSYAIETGNIIADTRLEHARGRIRRDGHFVIVDGLVGAMVLDEHFLRDECSIVLKENKDVEMFIGYKIIKDKVVFSLRAAKPGVDTLEITKRMGGNGHKGASSFSVGHEKGFKILSQLYSRDAFSFIPFMLRDLYICKHDNLKRGLRNGERGFRVAPTSPNEIAIYCTTHSRVYYHAGDEAVMEHDWKKLD